MLSDGPACCSAYHAFGDPTGLLDQKHLILAIHYEGSHAHIVEDAFRQSAGRFWKPSCEHRVVLLGMMVLEPMLHCFGEETGLVQRNLQPYTSFALLFPFLHAWKDAHMVEGCQNFLSPSQLIHNRVPGVACKTAQVDAFNICCN